MTTNELMRERVEELEAALDRAIDYLDRLPKHPETSRVLGVLAAARQGSGASAQTSRRPFVGTSFTRLGIPLLKVELHGHDLYVSVETPTRSNKELLAALRGELHVVRLHTLAPGDDWTELEVERMHGKGTDSR